MHSLAKVSQAMTITSTCPARQHTIEFDMKTLTEKAIHPCRPLGTTITIESLFELLPVRRYELLNKHREQLRRIDEMVKEYSLIYPEISFSLKNSKDGKEEIITFAEVTPRESRLLQWQSRVELVLGPKFAQAFVHLKTPHLEGWILGNVESGSSRENTFIRKNLHFMYLNKRPIDPVPKVQAVLN